MIHFVPRIKNFVELNKHIYFSVYDIPGLNDAHTKDVYFQYVKNNFHKFDIVVYIIDVKSGLNTSDEIDILNMIVDQIEINRKRNLIQKLIVVVNKCDDYNEDEEIREMYKQVENTIASKTDGRNIEYQIFPLSCEDAYMYRMIKTNPDFKLDDKYYNKIGINEYGKKAWNKKGVDKIDLIRKEIKARKIEPIKSGFDNITKYISDYLCGVDRKNKINQYFVLQNRIKYFWAEFLESNINTSLLASEWTEKSTRILVRESCDNMITWLEYARILQKKYKITEMQAPIKVLQLFANYLKTYFELYASYLDKIPSGCIEIIKEHLENILVKMGKHLPLQESLKTIIDSFRAKINAYYAESFQILTPSTIDDAKERLSILYKNNYGNINVCVATFLINGITNKILKLDGKDIDTMLGCFQKDYSITNSQMIDILLEILPEIYQILYNNYENKIIYLISEYLPDLHNDRNKIDQYHDLRIYLRILNINRKSGVVPTNPVDYRKWISEARTGYSLRLEHRLIQLLTL